MYAKVLAVVTALVILTGSLSVSSTLAQTTDRKVGEVQAMVARIGVGRNARVEAKLKDGERVKGYISASDSESFTVTDSKTGATQVLEYRDVTSVKKQSRGLSPLTWAIIGGTAAAATIVGFTVVKPVLCDGGAGC